MPTAWRSAVFDCDGVLLDSNEAKVAAFRHVLRTHPRDRVDAFLVEHRRTGGVSRHVKLRRFFAEFVPKEALEGTLALALSEFGAASRARLRECAEIPGARAVVEQLVGCGVSSFVVSGGEQEEVRDVLQRGDPPLGTLFVDVLGSPRSKEEHLGDLVERGALRAPGVYFGDAELDMRLAERHGLSFVLVAGRSDWVDGAAVASARGHRVVTDLRPIADELR